MCVRCDPLPRKLTGGQQQRVPGARAMVNRPDITVADEPCASPDSGNPKMVLEFFKESNEEMKQVIITVSHGDWYKDYIHRIIRLREGKYRATDSIANPKPP